MKHFNKLMGFRKRSNVKLLLSYDGTSFYGWQETKEGPSIEGALKIALHQILQEEIFLQAASRTDRGVHAMGQVVNFITKKNVSLPALKKSLNALLPSEIRILNATEVPLSFHPTLDALKKEYHYHITHGEIQMPHFRHYAWHVKGVLDLEHMRKGAASLLGFHDFSSFCNMRNNLNYADRYRKLEKIAIMEERQGHLKFEIIGNHFLYKMVRNLVGTLVDVGLSKLDSREISTILKAKSRPKAGITAPAHGLYLTKIFYGETND